MSKIAINYYPERLDPPRRGDYIFQTDSLNTVTLTEGVNIFDESRVKDLKTHRRFKSLQSLGALVVTEKIDPKEQLLPPKLGDIKGVNDVKTLIKTCNDLEQLKAWEIEEKEGKGRSTIISAISERISTMESQNLLNAVIAKS